MYDTLNPSHESEKLSESTTRAKQRLCRDRFDEMGEMHVPN